MTIIDIAVRSLPHLAMGAAVFYLALGKSGDSAQYKISLFLIGAMIGISPDFTKAFGDISLHSLLSVPFAAPVYALLLRMLLLNENLLKLTAATAATIVFAHLFVDAAGNGNALLYPLTSHEFTLFVLSGQEMKLSLVIVACLLFALVSPRGRVAIAGTLGAAMLWIASAARVQEAKYISLMINEVKQILL